MRPINELQSNKMYRNRLLQNIRFYNSNIEKSRFRTCDFENCNFVSNNLSKSIFHNCNFTNVDFSMADLSQTKFYRCNFHNCDFSSTYHAETFTSMNLYADCIWKNTNLSYSTFEYATFITDDERCVILDTQRIYNFNCPDAITTDIRFKNILPVPEIEGFTELAYKQYNTFNPHDTKQQWQTCGTYASLAGYFIHLAGDGGDRLEDEYGTITAALLIYLKNVKTNNRVIDFTMSCTTRYDEYFNTLYT